MIVIITDVTLDWCQIREMPSPKVSLEPQPSILIKVNWSQVSKIQNPASGSWMIYVKNIKVKINATKFKDICFVPHSEHLSSIFTVKKISCDQEGHVNGWTSNILIEASRAGLIFVMWSHERCRYSYHMWEWHCLAIILFSSCSGRMVQNLDIEHLSIWWIKS